MHKTEKPRTSPRQNEQDTNKNKEKAWETDMISKEGNQTSPNPNPNTNPNLNPNPITQQRGERQRTRNKNDVIFLTNKSSLKICLFIINEL